jgi:ABC-type antimicrobial peptide transport system permease subunit
MPGDINVYGSQTLAQAVEDTRWRGTFATALLGCLAAIALALGIAGIYGVVAHAVAQRVREIGMRVALGARTADVLALFVGGALRPAVLGVIAGAIAAGLLTRLLATLLFGVDAHDPKTFVAVAAAVLLAATLASAAPAWRASRVAPLASLRAE